MDLAIFGVQGSGKGTQAKIIAERDKMVIFETGEACRKLATEDSDLCRTVKSIVESGNLVSAEIVIQILEDFLNKLPAGRRVIYDGIPRNEDQQVAFDKLLQKRGRRMIGIQIMLPEEETIKRLMARGRHDDKPEVITRRIKIFLRDTMGVINDYRNKGKIIEINGNQPIEVVAQEISQKVDDYILS